MAELDTFETLMQAIDSAESAPALAEAVEALALTADERALPTLVTALNFNNPGAAVAAVDGLIRIGIPAVDPLLAVLSDQNYGARAWALRALAGIGDPRALTLLIETAKTDHALSVRRAAARGLGTLRWQDLPMAAVGATQTQVLEALTEVLEDPEWVVRYAAVVGLQSVAVVATQSGAIASVRSLLQTLVQTDSDPAVVARARLALEELSRLAQVVMFDTPDDGDESGRSDWQMTLEQVYRRKSEERQSPIAEGDPSLFRSVAAELLQSPGTQKKKNSHWPLAWQPRWRPFAVGLSGMNP
jgi:phycocyanobilin lyase beta subunit